MRDGPSGFIVRSLSLLSLSFFAFSVVRAGDVNDEHSATMRAVSVLAFALSAASLQFPTTGQLPSPSRPSRPLAAAKPIEELGFDDLKIELGVVFEEFLADNLDDVGFYYRLDDSMDKPRTRRMSGRRTSRAFSGVMLSPAAARRGTRASTWTSSLLDPMQRPRCSRDLKWHFL